MEIKKLEKIHLVRTNDFKKEDYESLIDFIQAICEKENRKNIFISYLIICLLTIFYYKYT